MLSSFPPRPFLGPFIARVALVWAFVRAVSVFGSATVLRAWGVAPGPGLPLGPWWLAGLVVGVVAFLVMLDMTRRSELLFLQNLGRAPARIGAAAVALCGVFEALIRSALG